MKALLVLGLLAFSTAGFSSVVKSYDKKNSCTLYKRVDNGEKGEVLPLRDGETLVNSKGTYGFTFSDMIVDFDQREVRVDVNVSVVAGFNQTLTKHKAVIEERNPNFTALINHLNRKVLILEKVCLSSDNRIIYVKEINGK